MRRHAPEKRPVAEPERLPLPLEVRLALFDASTERPEKRAVGVQTLLFRDWSREDLYGRGRKD
jgi:hypothetical protein